jgi:CheY-like chemotaxis protein
MTDATRILLLAEDNDDDAYLTTRALEEAGITHRIERCRNGQAVIEWLQGTLIPDSSGVTKAVPDLILIDFKMPRFGGLETLEWIRSQDAFRPLIVIALTSSTEPRDVTTAYLLHINAYLVKPSSLREMVALGGAIRAFWLDQKHFIPPATGLTSSGPARL